MKRIVVTASAVALCALASPANAAAPSDFDLLCGYAGVSGAGWLWGGPIFQNGTMTCTIKPGVSTHTGSTSLGASVSATGTNGTTTIPPTQVAYLSMINDYLCDQFTDAHTTWVLDDTTGTWVDLATNPGATCRLMMA